MKSIASSRGLLCGLALLANAGNAVSDAVGPSIDVWYGDPQSFGSPGLPQKWINILGNVSDLDGVKSLKYSLNNGPELKLSIGPDGQRLVDKGDFNIEIDRADLVNGTNNLLIRAWDTGNIETQKPVKFSYQANNSVRLPFTADWGNASTISDKGQVVDGRWQLAGGGVKTDQRGYVRQIAIGDMGWRNYEVTVPVTVHKIDLRCANTAGGCGGPSVSVTLRWQGHYDEEDDPNAQPRWGYKPIGARGGYFWDPKNLSKGTLEIDGSEYQNLGRVFGRTINFGETYLLKMRADTQAQGHVYSLKMWRKGDQEPPLWDIEQTEPVGKGLNNGSVVLSAHHVDATFGDVTVTPVGSNPQQAGSGSGGGGGGGGGGYALPLLAVVWLLRRRFGC